MVLFQTSLLVTVTLPVSGLNAAFHVVYSVVALLFNTTCQPETAVAAALLNRRSAQ